MNNTIDTTIQFVVPGTPRPGGSKRGFPIKRKNGTIGVAMTDSAGQSVKDWRASVVHAANEAMRGRPLIAGPVRLTVDFRMPRPKAHFRTGKRSHEMKPDAPLYHIKKPDTTKLLRPIEDAITGIVWNDDTQVVEQHATKHYGDKPKAVLTIVMLDPEEAGRHAESLIGEPERAAAGGEP